jgi:hypothetical protein
MADANRNRKVSVAFILTMPGAASWNGQWSGRGRLYARVLRISQRRADEIVGAHGYGWNDGWRANVEVRIVDAAESRRLNKNTQGFCGYDWMINSIIEIGHIKASSD